MVSGRPPERLTRERPENAVVAAGKREAAYDARTKQESERAPSVAKTEASQARIGVAATRVFHRPDCPLLKDVPATERIQFTSPWDGLDANYRPCETCRAMQ